MTKLLVIDTETGGLDPLQHSILSLAAVVWEDKQIIDSMEIKIWEGDDVVVTTPQALAINKIDLTELARTGLTPSAAVAQLMEFVGKHFSLNSYNDAILVGHNVGFDVGFSKRLFRLAGVNWPKVFGHRTIDTSIVLQFLIIATGFPLKTPNSKEAFEFFGVTPKNAHTAIDDAMATAEMFTKIIGLMDSSVENV
jgi:DNA polymerase III subunit epsilon